MNDEENEILNEFLLRMEELNILEHVGKKLRKDIPSPTDCISYIS
ncbi:hypothetical protein [Methanobrevibacter sp.]